MILLDTNVLSELLRPRPAPAVLTWMRTVADRDLRTTSVTRAELFLGMRLLPEGKRRRALETAMEAMFAGLFSSDALPFDDRAADAFAAIAAVRRGVGRPIGDLDAQIAAIALTVDAAVATRNTPDFELCGISLQNPWHVEGVA